MNDVRFRIADRSIPSRVVATILGLLLCNVLCLSIRDAYAGEHSPAVSDSSAGANPVGVQSEPDVTTSWMAWQQTVDPQVTPEAASSSVQDPSLELRELEEALQRPAVAEALQQEVTTVTGQQSTVGRSPTAVFVVTQEMIRRSGATSIPEALRSVPGLQVARVNSSSWPSLRADSTRTSLGSLPAITNCSS